MLKCLGEIFKFLVLFEIYYLMFDGVRVLWVRYGSYFLVIFLWVVRLRSWKRKLTCYLLVLVD